MLDIQVRLNNKQIGMIDITRSRGASRPDSVNVYEVCVHVFDLDWARTDEHPENQHVEIYTIRHRYGDGWPELLRKAMEAYPAGGT